MAIPETKDVSKMTSWHDLQQLADQTPTIQELFISDSDRGGRLVAQAGDIYLDYSKNNLDDGILAKLFELARESEIEAWRAAMFSGEKINTTEGRAVLHTALRKPAGDQLIVEGVDVVPQVHQVLTKMADFTRRIHSGEYV